MQKKTVQKKERNRKDMGNRKQKQSDRHKFKHMNSITCEWNHIIKSIG